MQKVDSFSSHSKISSITTSQKTEDLADEVIKHTRDPLVLPVVSTWHKTGAECEQWLPVQPAVRSELEHLMQRHVCHPYVVLCVHSNHMGQEEGAVAPRVDGVAGGVDGDHSVHGNWLGAIHTISVVAVNGENYESHTQSDVVKR